MTSSSDLTGEPAVKAWEAHKLAIDYAEHWPAEQQEAARLDFDAGFRAGLEAAREAARKQLGRDNNWNTAVAHCDAAISALLGDSEGSN